MTLEVNRRYRIEGTLGLVGELGQYHVVSRHSQILCLPILLIGSVVNGGGVEPTVGVGHWAMRFGLRRYSSAYFVSVSSANLRLRASEFGVLVMSADGSVAGSLRHALTISEPHFSWRASRPRRAAACETIPNHSQQRQVLLSCPCIRRRWHRLSLRTR